MKESTIGKRIRTLRKQRGMTQEQLAEQVGVSPQAVSKWENDNSCPDISVLPILAETLGVTVDMLLGTARLEELPKKETVYKQSSLKDEDEVDDDTGGSIELHMHTKKGTGILTGLFLAVLGVLLLLTEIHRAWFPCGFWELAWPISIVYLGLIWGGSGRISAANVVITLLGIYALLSNLKVLAHPISWTIVLAVVLLVLGLSYTLRYIFGWKKRYSFKKGNKRFVSSFTEEGGNIQFETSFGENRRRVSEPYFNSGSAQVSFGEGILDLRSVTSFADNAVLDVTVSFGDLIVYLPDNVRLLEDASCHFANTDYISHGAPAPDAPYQLTVSGDINFGNLDIRYHD